MKFKKNLYFGEKLKEYEIRVLNEREVRAASGILLLFASISFSNAWFTGNFDFLKVFVVIFMLDFFIRVLINPKFSPSLIIGRLIVSNQTPEYSGAPQKRFSWSIGLVLSILMFFTIVVFGFFGPLNLFICVICLTFLFFEAAFGICLGCIIYKNVLKKDLKLCPGGACDIKRKEEIQKINQYQVYVLVSFFILTSILIFIFVTPKNIASGPIKICEFPEYVKRIGHEEMYRLHHNCK